MLEKCHVTFLETVPFRTIATFTLFQLTYLLLCFGLTWIPIAGVLFPLLIMLLVPVRQYALPKFFKGAHLTDLDAAEYEESPALQYGLEVSPPASLSISKPALRETPAAPLNLPDMDSNQMPQDQASDGTGIASGRADDAEILSEMFTRSRGEIIHVQSPKITSSSSGTFDDIRLERSPRVGELRVARSLRLGRTTSTGSHGTPSPRPSPLARGARS